MQWHFNRLYQEVSNTNIQKSFFKKKDFAAKRNEESEEIEQAIVDNLEEKLINFKSPNLLNQMLPCSASNNNSDSILGKRTKSESTEEDLKKAKVARTDGGKGYASYVREQKVQEREKELLEKYLMKSSVTFKDLGGISSVLSSLREMIEWPLKYKSIFSFLGVKPPRGILISGPPGTGKT